MKCSIHLARPDSNLSSTALQVCNAGYPALRALLLADGDDTDCSARAHSLHSMPRTPSTTTMTDRNTMHTLTRRNTENTALSSTLHLLAARTPDCVMDDPTHREKTVLTMASDPRSVWPLHRARNARSRCCDRNASSHDFCRHETGTTLHTDCPIRATLTWHTPSPHEAR